MTSSLKWNCTGYGYLNESDGAWKRPQPVVRVKVSALGSDDKWHRSSVVERVLAGTNGSPASTVSRGPGDFLGEERIAEDDLVRPWAVSVASGFSLLRDPHHNKGLAFSGKERDAHYLHGLLPPTVVSQDLQIYVSGNSEILMEGSCRSGRWVAPQTASPKGLQFLVCRPANCTYPEELLALPHFLEPIDCGQYEDDDVAGEDNRRRF